ncbi:hypothetical protein JCM15519_25270 [Fundidesulfovibrio butyratiphilus]
MMLYTYVSAFFASSVAVLYLVLVTTALVLALFSLNAEARMRRSADKNARRLVRERDRGAHARKTMAEKCQRRNIEELAALITDKIRARQDAIEFATVFQTEAFIEGSVETLRFERLLQLSHALDRAEPESVSRTLDAFLQKELQYGHTGEHCPVHFQDCLHRQD